MQLARRISLARRVLPACLGCDSPRRVRVGVVDRRGTASWPEGTGLLLTLNRVSHLDEHPTRLAHMGAQASGSGASRRSRGRAATSLDSAFSGRSCKANVCNCLRRLFLTSPGRHNAPRQSRTVSRSGAQEPTADDVRDTRASRRGVSHLVRSEPDGFVPPCCRLSNRRSSSWSSTLKPPRHSG